jgi:hypothetical protein
MAMNYQLRESLDRLIQLIASAREREQSDEALNTWIAARAGMDALREARNGNPQMERLDACLASLESVVRCWSISGFRASFQLAGVILEAALIDPTQVDYRVRQAA